MSKLYSSTVVVDFEKSPANLVRQFKLLADLISDRTITIAREKNHMDFARLDFEIDKRNLGGGQVAVSKFILERRPNIAFEQERYFSSAPMTTSDHIKTLEDIERIASSA